MINPPSTASPHIVIVGAGILGATLAFQLSRRGARVTILEAGEPGRGASYASFAWINGRDKDPRHYHDLNRRSLDMWDRFARHLGGAADLTWGGELRWAATPTGAEDLLARVETLQSWGYPIRTVDPAELTAMEPNLKPGSVMAASYTEIDGHVNTSRVIQACLAQAAKRGAVLHTQTRVTQLQLSRSAAGHNQVRAVGTETGEIPCDMVILAGGPDTPELAALAGLNVPVNHTFGATLLTEATQESLLGTAAVIHTPHDLELQIVFRQLADGTMMIHGGSHGGMRDGSLGRDEAEVERVLATARGFMPALARLDLKEVRRARRPVPADGHPIIGFAEAVPNLYLVATHSGVTLAALIGELATQEILDDLRIDLLEPYRLERFN